LVVVALICSRRPSWPAVEAGENGGSAARGLDLLSWQAGGGGKVDLDRVFFCAISADAVHGAEDFPPLLDLAAVVVAVMAGI
jgi:hypothetical protein